MNRRERIRERLQSALSPTHLEVTDESRMHNVPAGAESLFKVVAVSESFAEHSLVACHRLVNKALQGEFESGLHAPRPAHLDAAGVVREGRDRPRLSSVHGRLQVGLRLAPKTSAISRPP